MPKSLLKSFLLLILLAPLLIFSLRANAQLPRVQNDPSVILTWQALNFVPSDYQGKTLPTAGTPFTAAVELVDNGKFASLEGSNVQWYVNGDLKQSGKNLKLFRYNPPLANVAESYALKVKISNYKNGGHESTVVVPLVHPELVIDAPYPNQEVEAISSVWRALVYFFDVLSPDALSFSWSANGETVDQPTVKNRIILDLTQAAHGAPLHLEATARFEPKLEAAGASITMKIK